MTNLYIFQTPQIVTGSIAIDQLVRHVWLSNNYTAALVDDFHWWAANEESDHSGKILLLHPERGSEEQQIFFDDNIEEDRTHIVRISYLYKYWIFLLICRIQIRLMCGMRCRSLL